MPEFRSVAALAAVAVASTIASSAMAGGRTIDYLAETCFSCHRSGATTGIPAITGRPGFEVVKALTEYKSGARKHPVMSAVAAEIPDEQVGMLAAFLAKQR